MRTPTPRSQVVGTAKERRRVYLLLHCGHRRLHNTRVAPPRMAYCNDCPPVEEPSHG